MYAFPKSLSIINLAIKKVPPAEFWQWDLIIKPVKHAASG
jgi:hypothetical protein